MIFYLKFYIHIFHYYSMEIYLVFACEPFNPVTLLHLCICSNGLFSPLFCTLYEVFLVYDHIIFKEVQLYFFIFYLGAFLLRAFLH